VRTAQESTRQTQTLEAELRAVSSKLEAVGTSLISLQAEGVASEASLAELQAAKRAAEAVVGLSEAAEGAAAERAEQLSKLLREQEANVKAQAAELSTAQGARSALERQLVEV
jgi:hypothetical protein